MFRQTCKQPDGVIKGGYCADAESSARPQLVGRPEAVVAPDIKRRACTSLGHRPIKGIPESVER